MGTRAWSGDLDVQGRGRRYVDDELESERWLTLVRQSASETGGCGVKTFGRDRVNRSITEYTGV